MGWAGQGNILTGTWFSSAQSSFIQKFQLDFCDGIWEVCAVLAGSKAWEVQNFLKKKFSVTGERFHIPFDIYFSASFAFYFLVSQT